MDENSLSGAFGQFLPGQSRPAEQPAEQNNLLVTSLRAAAGQSGGPLAEAVDAFLNGEGELHETTRAAVAKGSASPVADLAKQLMKQFNLKGPVAELVASLLVKLLPATKPKETAAKPKPRPRKEKPKPSASGKTAKKPKPKPKPKEASGAKKPKAKPKPKTTAKQKPKTK